jgi:hypothetical protein
VTWLQTAPENLELAGLTDKGVLHYATFRLGTSSLSRTSLGFAARDDGYRAATIARSGLIAGVRPSRIDWLRPGGRTLLPWSATEVALPTVVACFPSHPTRELIVVCRNGSIARVPMPN